MCFVQMQFTNIYIKVNTQVCTSCLNGVKTFSLTKLGEKKNYMMTWHVMSRHINLGAYISNNFLIKIYLVQHVTILND
jgi:hypothetical protein